MRRKTLHVAPGRLKAIIEIGGFEVRNKNAMQKQQGYIKEKDDIKNLMYKLLAKEFDLSIGFNLQ